MDLRQLEAFVAVAEERHFGRAALKLHLAEQAVGYQIRKLEDELGFRLFERTTRSVALTPAGTAFLESTRGILKETAWAADSARRIAAGEAGVVRLGYEVSCVPSVMPDYVRLFRAEYPDINLVLVERSKGGIASLLAKDTDACLVTRFERLPKGVSYLPILQDRAVIALQAGHPLADKGQVSLSELADMPFLGYSGLESGPVNRFLGDLATHVGIDSSVEQETESFLGLLGLVAAGIGFTIVTEAIAKVMPGGVAFVPMVNPEVLVDYGLAVREGDDLPTSPALITVAKHLKRVL